MKKAILIIVLIPIVFIVVLAVNYFIFFHFGSQITQGEPISQFDTLKQAILVIDVQEGTTGASYMEEYYMKESEKLIMNINQLTDSSSQYQVPVIYIKNEITNFLINILNDTYSPDHPGSKLDERLHIASDFILNKDKSDSFTNPKLDSILIQHKISKLIFTGLDLGHCVNSTILAAENRKYEICIISDAVLAKSDSLKTLQLNELKLKGHQVINSSEYIANLK